MTQTRQKADETVAIRVQKALWQRIRRRAFDRGETATKWLTRCAEICLAVAETGALPTTITREKVEPVVGSDAGETAMPKEHVRMPPVVQTAAGRPRVVPDRVLPPRAIKNGSDGGRPHTNEYGTPLCARETCGHATTGHANGTGRCTICPCYRFVPFEEVEDPS